MKKYIGIGLIGLSLFMLFRSIRVMSIGFLRIGAISTSGILITFIILSAIAFLVRQDKLTLGLLIGSFVALVLSIILGTRLYFTYLTLIDLMLIFVPAIIGIALILKDILANK
jgi:hypothetical protein